MFVAAALFPIDGRAARTMRLPGWNPPVRASRSVKPDGVPVRPTSVFDSSSSLSISSWRIASSERISDVPLSWPILNSTDSARSISSRASPLWLATSSWISRVAFSTLLSSECSLTIRA